MLAIRLARTGRKKYPTYRIVAAESARATTGKFVAILGHYNPHTKEIVIKKDETLKYLGNGAQPSNAVIKLLQREKVELPAWAKLKTRDRAPKKPVEAKAPESTNAETVTADAEPEPAESNEPEAHVATAAADQEQATSESAPAATDLDSDHTDTADSETEAAEAADAASDTAAEVASETTKTDTESSE